MKFSVLLPLSFASIVALLGITYIIGLSLIDISVREISQSQIPRQEALYQMEIFMRAAARDILEISKLEPMPEGIQLDVNMDRFKAAKESYFAVALEGDEETIHSRFVELSSRFEALGDEMVLLQEEQALHIAGRADNFALEEIHYLRSILNGSGFVAADRALYEMEISLYNIESETNNYLASPSSETKERVDESIQNLYFWLDDFEAIAAQIPINTTLRSSSEDMRILTGRIISLEDRENEVLAEVLQVERQLQGIISNELRPLHQARVQQEERSAVGNIILTLMSVMLVITAAVVVATLASRKVLSQTKKLQDAVKQVEEGNLDNEIRVQGNDELAALQRSFNAMTKRIKMYNVLQREFLAIASHELRNPVHVILNYASLAASGNIPNDKAVKTILKHASRLQHLSNDILDVTRIEAGKLTYYFEKVDVNYLIKEVADSFMERMNVGRNHDQYGDNNNSFELHLDSTRDVEISADKERIKQVLLNIINNANKFTNNGKITVQTAVVPVERKGSDEDGAASIGGQIIKAQNNSDKAIEIKISDTGTGIDHAILPRLFEKFASKQVDEGGQKGTGLGLFISRAIIRSHGGDIVAYNNADGKQGATVVITIPILDGG